MPSMKPSKKSDMRKQSLYFPEWMLEEIRQEARMRQLSISRVAQDAWRIARKMSKKRHPPGIAIMQEGPLRGDDPITKEIKS